MNPKAQAETVMVRLRKQGMHVILDDIDPRPWSFTPTAVLLHHTASTSVTSIENEKSDINVLQHGTADWPPPKVQWYVGRTGRIYLLTKGGANHAGTGTLAAHGIPENMGNKFMWGIEAQSRGLKPDWTKDQWEAVHRLTAELCRVMGTDQRRVWRHKDYDDDSGKIDTQYPLEKHREAVREYLKEDEMQPEDFARIRDIVGEEIDKRVDDIAEQAAATLLGSDLFPKKDDIDRSVRQALKEAGKA